MKKILPLLFLFLLFFIASAGAVCIAPQWEISPLPPDGVVRYRTVFSPVLGANATYAVYLPPSYATSPTRHYPVLYWLHGGGGNMNTGAKGFSPIIDDAMRRGAAPEFIVVYPNGPQEFWTDSNPSLLPFKSPIESFILDELIPRIDADYRTIPDRAGRGVEGFSMGGRGALQIGLGRPDLFGLVSDLAGAVHGWDFFAANPIADIMPCVFDWSRPYFEATSPQTRAAVNAGLINSQPYHYRVAVGSSDNGRNTFFETLEFSDYLDGLSIFHEFKVVPDVKHSFQGLYGKGGDAMFNVFVRAWGGV